jgi:hypothetical protein
LVDREACFPSAAAAASSECVSPFENFEVGRGRERERYGFASFSLSLLSGFFLQYDILFCCSFFQVWRRRVCTLKPNLDLCFQFRAQFDAGLYKIFGAATGKQGSSGGGGGGGGGCFGFQ